MAISETFEVGFRSYDIHTYYRKNDSEEKERLLAVRAQLLEDFAEEIEKGDIRVHKVHEDVIGPHPIAMWEIDFKKPEIFARVVPWYQRNHRGLSVLIHPFSDKGQKVDHTEHALWLGHKQRLIIDKLPD